MIRISPALQGYAWGSPVAIHELLGVGRARRCAGRGVDGRPPERTVAGRWIRAESLDDVHRPGPAAALGEDVVARFGPRLPYLLKVIAADRPLSLQVHPNVERGPRRLRRRRTLAGVPVDAAHRNYRDRNHKPELVFALTTFEAICGFRAPRRAAELFEDLDAPLAKELHGILAAQPTADGMRAAFTQLLEPATRPSAEEVAGRSPARARTAWRSVRPHRAPTARWSLLAEAYPGDPGVVTSLLLNPVTLQPGDAMFVPAGGVHAYLAGVAVEIMASSDNVLRAGLTPKHVDVPELLRNVDYVAAPPIRDRARDVPRRDEGLLRARSTTSSCRSPRSATTAGTRCPDAGRASCCASTARRRSWRAGRAVALSSSRAGRVRAGRRTAR